ncbi:MAG: hypothetical protein ACTS3F_02960 [Phycisphaerales bacterium]
MAMSLALILVCLTTSCSPSGSDADRNDAPSNEQGDELGDSLVDAEAAREAAREAAERLRAETLAELREAPIAEVIDAALTGQGLRFRLALETAVERLDESAAEALLRVSNILESGDISDQRARLEYTSAEAALFRLLGTLADDQRVIEELRRLASSESIAPSIRRAAVTALAQSGAASEVPLLFDLASAGAARDFDLAMGVQAAVRADAAEPAFRDAFFDHFAAADRPDYKLMAMLDPERFLREIASVDALRAADRDTVGRIFLGLALADLTAGHDATLDTLRRFEGDRAERRDRPSPLSHALTSAASHDSPELRAVVLRLTDHPSLGIAAQAASTLAQIHGVAGAPIEVSPDEPLGDERHQHIATGFVELFMGSNYAGFFQTLDRADGLDPFPNMILAARETGIEDLVKLVETFHAFMKRSDGLHPDPDKRAAFWEGYLHLEEDDWFAERFAEFGTGIYEYFPEMERTYYLYLVRHRELFLRDRAALEAKREQARSEKSQIEE